MCLTSGCHPNEHYSNRRLRMFDVQDLNFDFIKGFSVNNFIDILIDYSEKLGSSSEKSLKDEIFKNFPRDRSQAFTPEDVDILKELISKHFLYRSTEEALADNGAIVPRGTKQNSDNNITVFSAIISDTSRAVPGTSHDQFPRSTSGKHSINSHPLSIISPKEINDPSNPQSQFTSTSETISDLKEKSKTSNNLAHSPANRRLSNNFRLESAKKYNNSKSLNSDPEIQNLLKERDDLKNEMERLQSKNLSLKRGLEMSIVESQAVQKNLNDTIDQDRIKMNSLLLNIRRLEKSSNTQELEMMLEEYQRLGLNISNSEAQKEKLKIELDLQSSKIETLRSEIDFHIREKTDLQTSLSSSIDEKLKLQKIAQEAISKSKKMEKKLLDSQKVYEKLIQSQSQINEYESNIQNLSEELEASKLIIQHYSENYDARNDITFSPSPNVGSAYIMDSNSLENITNSHPNASCLYDLFSKCQPSEFLLISTLWKKLTKGDDPSQQDQVGELALNLAKSDFISILESHLNNPGSNSFVESLKKSKNKQLLESLGPSIDSYEISRQIDEINFETPSSSSDPFALTNRNLRNRRQNTKIKSSNNNESPSSTSSNNSSVRVIIIILVAFFLGALTNFYYYQSHSDRSRIRSHPTELNDDIPPIQYVRNNQNLDSSDEPRYISHSYKPNYIGSFLLSFLIREDENPDYPPT
ncbi:hypothetical protein AYI68_g8112 [Smittium mucronatum]|uniref:Uncharacterized protein n=1 Tax=Smittium mucronatum TaxID=133383 RepID=A0A1R0GLT0_9FUNG|nr:hypothetical protein AYI68_g8112 [Smittium mucronatum]